MLVYYKRIVGARNISEEDIPIYMDEYDQLEDLYFGKVKEENKFKEAKLKGVYYYSNLAKPPATPSQHVPYRLLVELASVAPDQNAAEYISKRLIDYRAVKQIDEGVMKRISLAISWQKEFSLPETEIQITEKEKAAIVEVSSKVASLKDPQEIQTLIFDTARSNGLEPSELFKAILQIVAWRRAGAETGSLHLGCRSSQGRRKI